MEGTLTDWASAIGTSPLAYWIGGSLLLYGLGANILWFLRGALRHPYARWLVQVGRFAFYLVIPYLALGGWPQRPFQGLLSLDEMGIVGLSEKWPVTRWLEAAGVGVGWGLLALVMLGLGLTIANRRSRRYHLLFKPVRGWAVLVNVLYLQVHWAFYRGALWMILGDVYAAAFLGLGLVYLELALNPFWRQGWQLASPAAEQWARASLALVSALLFLLSRNLWVCLAIHLLVEFSVRQLGRERVRHRSPASSTYDAEVSGAE